MAVTAPARLLLRWVVSRDGCAGVLELRLPSDGPVAAIVAELIEGGSRRRIDPSGASAWVHAAGLRHLDVPGVLSVSLRCESGIVAVYYARTWIPASLGLPGGTYEFEGGSILAE